MFRIAICDPDADQARQIESYVARDTEIDDDYEVDSFHNISDVRKRFSEKDFGYDLLFLHIGGDGEDSLDLLRMIRENHYDLDVWFLAENVDHINEAFHYRASDYVLKPLSYSLFAREMHEYLASKHRYQRDILKVKFAGKEQLIQLGSVAYFSSDSRKIGAYFSQGMKKIWFYEKMDQLASKLKSYGFIRIHQSYLVNGQKINGFTDNEVNVEGEVLPVSRRYMRSSREKWNELQKNQIQFIDENSKTNWNDEATSLDSEATKEKVDIYPIFGVVTGIQGCSSGSVRLYDDEWISIGRDSTKCHIVSESTKVSREHCRIKYCEKTMEYMVMDISTNGVYEKTIGRLPRNKWVTLNRDTIIRLSSEGCRVWLG